MKRYVREMREKDEVEKKREDAEEMLGVDNSGWQGVMGLDLLFLKGSRRLVTTGIWMIPGPSRIYME